MAEPSRSLSGASERAGVPPPVAGAALVVGALAATAAGSYVGLQSDGGDRLLILTVAVLMGGVLGVLAVTRFWLMIVVLFAVRPSIDALAPGGVGSGGLSPNTVVGAVFLLAAGAWLIGRRRSGEWIPMSRAAVALVCFSGAALLSSVGAANRGVSFQQSSKLVSIALMLVVLEQVFGQDPERIKVLLGVLFASAVVPLAVAYLQLVTGSRPGGVDAVDVGRINGTFAHPNSFGAYLTILILLAVALSAWTSGWWRRSLLSAAGFAGVIVLFTYARGAWIALCIALLFVGLTQSRPLVFGVLGGLVIVMLTVPSVSTRLSDLEPQEEPEGTEEVATNSFSWRLGYWERVLPLSKDNPVTGIGFEMVRELEPEQLSPHNAFVQAFVEMGALGLGCLFWFIGALWADLRRAAYHLSVGLGRGLAVGAVAVSISVFVQLFSENLLNEPGVVWYFLVPVAWVLAVGRRGTSDMGEPVALAGVATG